MIDLNEVMSRVTIVARRNNLRIRGRRWWVARYWVSTVAFRIGAWVAGFDFEESDWEEE